MPKIQYNCCFCSKPGEVEYDEPEGVDKSQLGKLASLMPSKIACDRCARYERTRRDLGRHLLAAAVRLSGFSIEDRETLKARLRPKLERVLQKLCKAYERRFSLAPFYEPQMVEQILEVPESTDVLLRQIARVANYRF